MAAPTEHFREQAALVRVDRASSRWEKRLFPSSVHFGRSVLFNYAVRPSSEPPDMKTFWINTEKGTLHWWQIAQGIYQG